MALTDTRIRAEIKAAIKNGKGGKLYDELDLYMILKPRDKDCGCWWRQDYVWNDKEQTLSVGTYPKIGLAEARRRGEEIRTQVANKINPSEARKEEKAASRSAAERVFQALHLAYIEKRAKDKHWTEDHLERVKRRHEVHTWPWIGKKLIEEVADDDILECLNRLSDVHKSQTGESALREIKEFLRHSKARKLVKHNAAVDLSARDIFPSRKVKHHASLKDPPQVGGLLRAIDNYHGGFVVKCALRFAPLVFVRPVELRLATWSQFDLDQAEWRIPAEHMKMRVQHIVPLSRQAIAILRELLPLTGPDGLVFPQVRNASRPLSENTLNVGLRACGYSKDQQTAHGFRSMASTLLNGQGFNRDWIERQLAHDERDKSRGSYNFAEYLPERRKMMQAWADYLDGLKSGGKVIPIRAASESRHA